MGMRRPLAVAACLAAVVGTGAGSAFAGEITGNGKFTPVHDHIAASICSFSGREDGDPPGDPTPNQPQTPHHVWFGVDLFPPPGDPGTSCNPTRATAGG